MALSPEHHLALERFVHQALYDHCAVILDLDGTVLLEDRGKIFISSSVVRAVKHIASLKYPIILNTLRFPLSVIRTIASEWLDIEGGCLPVILLNGSLIGYIERRGGEIFFKEIKAFPLTPLEIDELIKGIEELIDNDVREMVLFFYPRDWRRGEIIWTPKTTHVDSLRHQYKVSVSEVVDWDIKRLREELKKVEPCMVHLSIEQPRDKLMAYQHSRPTDFFTHAGVDKASGSREMSAFLGIHLLHSIGAGDKEMDTFLSETGMSIIVGKDPVPFRGKYETVTVDDPMDLGDLLTAWAELMRIHI